MHRFLPHVIVIVIGIVLILIYLVIRSSSSVVSQESDIGAATTSAVAAQPNKTRLAGGENSATGSPVTVATATVTATSTPQPIVPTRTPSLDVTSQSSVNQPGENQPELTPARTRAVTRQAVTPCPLPDCLNRAGVSGPLDKISAADKAGLKFGQYLSWWVEPDPPGIDRAHFWQLIPVNPDGPRLDWDKLEEIITAQPGSTWIIGNEPDIIWQDNIEAEQYALIYHDLYTFIKNRDPSSLIAIAGVGQPTPLRMAYLDLVLDTYQEVFNQEMPVDIWTIHAFVLREEQDSWGVGIPPGMDIERGELYEVEDHDNLDYFSQNLINFRAWMADRGYSDVPLAVTEYGILHPAEYGFPPEAVARFMIGAFDFFSSSANSTGYPADEYRLVQWWFWYSVYDAGDYPTGNLFNPETGQLTQLGLVFNDLVAGKE